MLIDQDKRQTILLAYRKIKASPVLKYIVYVLVVLSIIGIYSFLASKGYLDISNVSIKPSQGQDLKYVNKELVTETILGLKSRNYFEINIDDLERKVKSNNPFIESAFFTKTFPNKILVEITPRIPYMILQINSIECALLTDSGFVLDKEEYQAKSGCPEIIGKYKVPILKINDSKIPFDVNTQSAFFTITDIAKMRKVFAEYGVVPTSYELKNSVIYSYIDKDTYIVTSANQDMTTQLSRFVVVMNEIEQRGIKFKSLDLRYKRPVINKK